MTEKTHWKKLINPDYIGAYSMPDSGELTVTIDYVQSEEIIGSQGKKDFCTVAHLVGEKPMILNVTNNKSIAKLYGNYVEDWAGKRITLYSTTTRLGGETVECLRIRPNVAKREKAQITEARLDKAIEAIIAKTYTRDKLDESFILTDEQDKKVTDAIAAAIGAENGA
jgi:hypothetical protein